MPAGRPSLLTPELAKAICERMSRGEPMSSICDDPDMPDYSTLYRWERDNAEFRKLSADAREAGTHFLAGDCLRIADDDELEPADKRVRIDTRIRLIGKWNAKAYGEALQMKHSGAIGRFDASKYTDEQLDRLEGVLGDLAVTGGDAEGGEGGEGAPSRRG